MPISDSVREALTRSSWIRRMFEEGNRLKEIHGAENVFDFALGNPDLPPPAEFDRELRRLVEDPPPGLHRYMPNAGWPEARSAVAAHLTRRTTRTYGPEHIVMTVGAGGALNVCFKALLNPGDEVVILAPYFVEYLFYIPNHGGVTVVAETRPDFHLDVDAIAEKLTPRTRVVLMNAPNNPTGRVYHRAELDALAGALEDASRRHGQPIYLVTDEPYRKIIYDGVECPEVPDVYPHTILITSHSKDLGLAGERIGYLAVSPTAEDAEEVAAACTFSNRILGFVNAPSLFQLAVAACQDVQVDAASYQRRRDVLAPHLQGLGFDLELPEGAFYLFPRSPVEDETEFIAALMEEKILAVPGRGFGRAGYFRISYAVPDETIERSLPAWERVADRYPQLVR